MWKVAPSYQFAKIKTVDEATHKALIEEKCDRCGGTGIIAARVENGHIVPIPVDGGVCYKCNSAGVINKWVKAYTEDEYDKYIASQKRAKERKAEKAELERQEKLNKSKENQEELRNTSPDPETEEKLLAAAESRWARAGYTIDQTMSGSVIFENAGRSSGNERIRVDYLNEDLSVYRTYVTDPAGNLLELQNVTNNWQDTFEDWHFEEYPDQKLVKKTEEELLGWLEDENPVLLSSGGLSLISDWWYQNDDGLYLSFREGAEQVNHAWNEVYFVVRVAPEWRIEYFGCIGNG